MARLKEEQHNYPALTPSDVEAALALAETLLRGVLSIAPEARRPDVLESFCAKLAFLKGVTFEHSNGFPRQTPDYNAFMDSHLAKFANGTAIHLELGSYNTWSKERSEQFVVDNKLGDMITLDMNVDYKPDVAASVTALPFADESIDVISSNSLFEHVAYPHEIIREALRVLRPGGALNTMMPFHFPVHGCPHDYGRYTPQFFDEVCLSSGFAEVRSDAWAASGVYYSLHQLLKGVTAVQPAQSVLGVTGQLTHLAVMVVLAALQGIDDHFDNGGHNHFTATRSIAVKGGAYVPPVKAPDRTRPFLDRTPFLICPATGLPLRRSGDGLVSLDGRRCYAIKDGVPSLFVLHGFASPLARPAASSRRQLREFQMGPLGRFASRLFPRRAAR